MSSLHRPRRLADVERVLRRLPVCALLGPRQCGKTTLAKELARSRPGSVVFDLETAAAREALAEPELALSRLRGLVVIDEIQRDPRLFETLRPLADRPRHLARFLVLGSASPSLLRGVSETLAGRVGFVDLSGFDLEETGAEKMERLWQRGGFPRSYLAKNEDESLAWRRDFVRTYLERDVPSLGISIQPESLRRFWTMIAHYHGQIWNGAELARSLGVNEHAVRRWLDVLCGTYVARQLAPWFENLGKRQFKSPKVYVRDSGILHALLGVASHDALAGHPKIGASWEGFALEQLLALSPGAEAYYWGTHAGAELDLLILHGGRRYGVEFKYADAPAMTKSLHVALADLRLERAWIVHPGTARYAVHERVEVLGLADAIAAVPFVEGRTNTARRRRRPEAR
jgi:predicted AAA+ superfamily ATPase